ncbi:MAG: hypothetical protein ACK5LC_06160 [Coprobacillaceae bacterium]
MNQQDIYTTVCYTYLKTNKRAKIHDVENVLFLMQYNRLKDENKPLYEGETYITEEGIKVSIVSDLLRVMPMEEFTFYPNKPSIFIKVPNIYTIEKNRKEAEQYAKITTEEISKRVIQIIESNDLDKRYFVFKNIKINKIEFSPDIRQEQEKKGKNESLVIFYFRYFDNCI